MALTWTEKQPTKPGWYWYVEKGFEHYSSSSKIMEIFMHKGRIIFCQMTNFPYTFDNPNVLWAGPIPVPVKEVTVIKS